MRCKNVLVDGASNQKADILEMSISNTFPQMKILYCA